MSLNLPNWHSGLEKHCLQDHLLGCREGILELLFLFIMYNFSCTGYNEHYINVVAYVYNLQIIHEYTPVGAASQHFYSSSHVYQMLTIDHWSRNRIFINGRSPCAIWEIHGLF